MSNNAAERAVRCVAVGRKNWIIAGSDEGGRRAAAMFTLIGTPSDIGPHAWLVEVLARLPDIRQRIDLAVGSLERQRNIANVDREARCQRN